MNDEVIEYKSSEKRVADDTDILEAIDNDGIACTWEGSTKHNNYHFYWSFDWSELEKQGVERITGYLILKGTGNSPSFGEHKIDIDFKETTRVISSLIIGKSMSAYAAFEYHLTRKYSQKIEKIFEMFAASEMNDTVLVVEGKKLHVNKVFLSCHSDYFRALFSSNFKEGQMTEIPIKEVTYEDFGLLISTIYPKQVFPADKTAEKLLVAFCHSYR